jgi:hypothetical protein
LPTRSSAVWPASNPSKASFSPPLQIGKAALEEHRQTAHYCRCVEMIEPITIGGRQKRYFARVLVESGDR